VECSARSAPRSSRGHGIFKSWAKFLKLSRDLRRASDEAARGGTTGSSGGAEQTRHE
jgi:hypothetical protein